MAPPGKSVPCPAYVRRTVIMRAMGWSYREYRETPVRVIEDVERVLGAEAKARMDREKGASV